MLVHARDTLRSLRNSGSPFMLTLLTLDTHNPPGIFDTCATDDMVREATALKCSMRAVAGFIADLNAQGYLEDTVVVVMTDHLKATGETVDYRAALGGVPHRTLLLRVSSPDGVTFSRSGADQFSVLASSLELLGFHVPDGRAGLGVSFVSPHDLTGTPLALPADEYTQLIDAPSSVLYDQFWQGK
jgi:phosphoglycerol transferase